jgi:hypothetical protein
MKTLTLFSIFAGAAVLTGCATTPVERGIVGGGAVGAATGAIIGSASGHAGEGALIGAGVGAVTGALIGDAEQRRRSQYYAPPYPPAPPHGAVVAPPAPPRHGSTHSYRVDGSASQRGHWETRVMRGPSGERYEERVWIPAP